MTTRLAMPNYILEETAGRTVQEVEQMAKLARLEHSRAIRRHQTSRPMTRELFEMADRAMYLAIQADRMREEGAK